MVINQYLAVAPEVQAALEAGRPVVALESAIIAHGMPYPDNAATALKAAKAVADNGALAATTALIDGKLKVGLSGGEIQLLAKTGAKVSKLSRRDLPMAIAKRQLGATTVASAMLIAAKAGIEVLATGGIGGVHRGASASFDVSADLQELARTNVAVVCAGCKSILDIGKTLEYLETRGVPVIGYRTDKMPAFYLPQSEFALEYKLDSPAQVAKLLHIKWQAGFAGGAVIANPIQERYALAPESINGAIETALAEADEQNVVGKRITPFLLARVAQLTGGDSLQANIELVLNNARIAARIAAEYSRL